MASKMDIFAFFDANYNEEKHYVVIGTCSCPVPLVATLVATLDLLPESFNAICTNNQKHNWKDIQLHSELAHLKRRKDVTVALDSWRSFREYIPAVDRVTFPVGVHHLAPAPDPETEAAESAARIAEAADPEAQKAMALAMYERLTGSSTALTLHPTASTHFVNHSHVIVTGDGNGSAGTSNQGIIERLHGTAHFIKDSLYTYGPRTAESGIAIYLACRTEDANCLQRVLSNAPESAMPSMIRTPAADIIVQGLTNLLKSAMFKRDLNTI